MIVASAMLVLASACGRSSSPAVGWHPNPSTLSPSDERQVRTALAHEAQRVAKQLPPGTHLDVAQASSSGSSVVMYASEVQNGDGSVVPTEALVILGTRSASGDWALVFPGDPGFCQAINGASGLDSAVKSYFVGC